MKLLKWDNLYNCELNGFGRGGLWANQQRESERYALLKLFKWDRIAFYSLIYLTKCKKTKLWICLINKLSQTNSIISDMLLDNASHFVLTLQLLYVKLIEIILKYYQILLKKLSRIKYNNVQLS